MADPNQQQSVSAARGASAVCRVDGETFLGSSADCLPTPTNRQLPVDATGLYILHDDDPNTNAQLSLQLNQVGHALVGWITHPRSFVTPLQNILPSGIFRSAVLVADLDPAKTKGRPDGAQTFPAAPSTNGSRVDLKTLNGIAGHDPTEALDPACFVGGGQNPDDANTMNLVAWIGFDVIEQPGTNGWEPPQPRLRATLAFSSVCDLNKNPLGPLTLFFDMIHVRPRVSERTIEAQEPKMKRYLIAQHRIVTPPSFFSRTAPSGAIVQRARSIFSTTGELAQLIQKYELIRDAKQSERDIPVERIKQLLRDAVQSWQMSGDDDLAAKLMTETLRSQLQQTLTVTLPTSLPVEVLHDVTRDSGANTATRSLIDWIGDIGANEVASLPASASSVAPGAIASLQAYPAEFRWVTGGTVCRYSMVFSSLDPAEILDVQRRLPSLPPWILKHIPKIPDADHDFAAGLAGAMGVFKLTISASSAAPTKDGAPPSESDFKPVWAKKVCYGVFFELGSAIGGIPKLPSELVITSSWMLQPQDFDHAVFDLDALGAEIKLGDDKVGSVTQKMTFHNLGRDGISLEGTSDDGSIVVSTLPKLPWGDIAKKAWKAKRKGLKEGLLDMVTLGGGIGSGALMFGMPDVKKWVKPAPRRTTAGGDGRTVATFFKLDSAELNTYANGVEARFALEVTMAVDMYLFNGAPNFDVVGYASPEGTPRHNLILSKLRAAAVRQAILDTHIVDPDFVGATGVGDELALRTPVHPEDKSSKKFEEPDPDGNTTKRDDFAQAHQEEADRWPEFRKVEVDWWGQFFCEIQTIGDQSDEDAAQTPASP